MQAGKDAQLNLTKALILAYQNACRELAQRNPWEMAENSGARYDSKAAAFFLKYLNEEYRITYSDGQVSFAAADGNVSDSVKIVLLHYLLKAGGLPLTKTLIAFNEIPEGGLIYYEPFKGRVVRGILATFGKKPELLSATIDHLGGQRETLGSASGTLAVLPKVPMTFIVWAGDEEVPANAAVLFDANVRYYLSTEDLVVAASTAARLLSNTAKTMSS